jgi:mannan endo-1,4-beta-mannosidase
MMNMKQYPAFINCKLLLLLVLSMSFACSGANSNEDDEPDEVAPALVSTTPANNATVSPSTNSVDFVFDREIVILNKTKITLNGQSVSDATVSGNTLTAQLGHLDAKTNYTVTIAKSEIKAKIGKVNPEAISLTFTTGELPFITLVVKNPSPEAVKLYNFLQENYGKKIISGTVANVNWNTNEADWVFQHTGKYPALNGFDYIHSYANWVDYANTKVVEDWWNNKGIVNCLWHWNVPRSQGSNDYAFYTKTGEHAADGTSFDISKAVQEGTYENGIVKADLEKIANHLLLLKNKNIPVLWRPLHEAAGGWFWWGAKGAEPCKALWKLMFETFAAKGLNNLIWVWTAEPNDNAWYPGDEYVDIVGRDIYNKTAANQLIDEYNTLKNRYPNKMVTLSECGNVAGISEQLNAGAYWSWFMPWYDYERTNAPSGSAFKSEAHQYADATYWKNAFNNSKVITRDQMPSFK